MPPEKKDRYGDELLVLCISFSCMHFMPETHTHTPLLQYNIAQEEIVKLYKDSNTQRCYIFILKFYKEYIEFDFESIF